MLTRKILFGLFLLSSSVYGQVHQNQNSNQQEPSVQKDTIVVLDELEIKSEKAGRKKMKAASYERTAAPSKEVSVAKDMEVQSASAGFVQSKNMAANQRVQRSPTTMQQQAMDDAVSSLEKTAPNSFEYHYYKYVAGNYDVSLIDHLDKAESIRPNNTDVHVQKAAYYHITKNDTKAKEYLSKLVAAKRLDGDLKYYAEDLLLSVPKNGTLLTHGFDDTYSALYTQLNFNVRSDVRVVSLDMLQSDEYRSKLKSEGYKLPNRKTVDISFFREFVAQNESKSIAVSLTTPKEYFKPIQGNLYLTGLVFEYHSSAYDNLHRNEKLWDKKLKKYPVNNSTNDKMKNLSSNYLPMLLVLYKHYKENGEQAKLESVEEAMTKVSVQCGKYETVKRLKDSY
ncbi:MAG: hypothetical protein ACO2Z9_02680 [Crocinitomicaceae bacterium]